MDSTRQVPAAALHFDAASPLTLAATADSSDAPRVFAGVAYSGDVIRNHFFWGNVIFDLASTSAPERVPVLIEHDRAQRAGVGQLAIGENIRIDGTLLANASGQAIASEADAGFPWQLSVHIEPGSAEASCCQTQTSPSPRVGNTPGQPAPSTTHEWARTPCQPRPMAARASRAQARARPCAGAWTSSRPVVTRPHLKNRHKERVDSSTRPRLGSAPCRNATASTASPDRAASRRSTGCCRRAARSSLPSYSYSLLPTEVRAEGVCPGS
ncbi:MAG: hypothetical protein K8F35_04685 [Dokdonella sp.]|uniref:hypothetical protein n=1 Tax=Dokdonella sp. TaxID=2291710 RepID=UPI0025C6267E|nr:hypothetical protein [Dokdonella sp.]MBZ0222303.1 hypothetical protein [Dokdonella sp.]